VAPYEGLEERLYVQDREAHKRLISGLARLLRALGKEGWRIYRHRGTNDVWEESAGEGSAHVDLHDPQGFQRFSQRHRGPYGASLYDLLLLTDEEAKALSVELYDLWRRYKLVGANDGRTRKPYELQFIFVPLEPK
jgi:hypothetical protein